VGRKKKNSLCDLRGTGADMYPPLCKTVLTRKKGDPQRGSGGLLAKKNFGVSEKEEHGGPLTQKKVEIGTLPLAEQKGG